MKPFKPTSQDRAYWSWAAIIGATLTPATLHAADPALSSAQSAPAPMSKQDMFEGGTNGFNNWVEVSTGGFVSSGNHAQAQQTLQNSGGPFGGISSFHYQQDLNKTTTLTADGHALFDEHSYKFNLGVTREKFGYLRFSFNEFRTWYNGDGGFYSPVNAWYPFATDALGIDRGQLSF